MNASYNYFLSERIALAACKAIDKNPETPLEKENLVKLQHGNISKENAQKNINTLKKLDILDETGLPTDRAPFPPTSSWATSHTFAPARSGCTWPR